MNVMQNYGVLRVVCGNHGSRGKIAGLRSSTRENSTDRERKPASLLSRMYLGRWLPEERLAHILSQRETTIGRALSSDIILLDPTVSRDHARLVLGEHGWFVQNLTENNVVRVNSHIVAGGAWSPLQPQDLLIIGNTTLQLVAPLLDGKSPVGMDERSSEEDVSLWSSVTMQFAFLRLLQYPQTDRSNGEKLLQPSVSPGVDDADETVPTMRRSGPLYMGASPSGPLALGSRARRFFIVGGLLSIVVIAGVFLVLSSLNRLFGFVQDGAYSFILAVAVPLIPALGIYALVSFVDRYEREPWFLRLAAFLWGAIIAIPSSLFIENFIDGIITRLWGVGSQVVLYAFLSGLDAGITEETIKGLGLLLLFFFLRDEFDNITDGIVYGALIGAGFAMVENSFYFLRNPNDVPAMIVGRIVLGWLSHSTFTICLGVALGYVRHTRVRWRRSVVPWSGYLLAVCLHTVFDFVNIFVRNVVPTYGSSPTVALFAILAVIGNYIPLFVVQVGILYVLIRSLMHEAAIIREFLPSEVANGVITVDEYALLPHSFARTRLERQVLWRYGVRQWLLTRALYQTEIGLAFRKWHVSMSQSPLTDRGNEESLTPFLTSAGVDNSNETTPDMSNGSASGNLRPEEAYRKRIKRIRREIAAHAPPAAAPPIL